MIAINNNIIRKMERQKRQKINGKNTSNVTTKERTCRPMSVDAAQPIGVTAVEAIAGVISLEMIKETLQKRKMNPKGSESQLNSSFYSDHNKHSSDATNLRLESPFGPSRKCAALTAVCPTSVRVIPNDHILRVGPVLPMGTQSCGNQLSHTHKTSMSHLLFHTIVHRQSF
jgi:hypothetical protein